MLTTDRTLEIVRKRAAEEVDCSGPWDNHCCSGAVGHRVNCPNGIATSKYTPIPRACPRCNGTGKVARFPMLYPRCGDKFAPDHSKECVACNGTSQVLAEPTLELAHNILEQLGVRSVCWNFEEKQASCLPKYDRLGEIVIFADGADEQEATWALVEKVEEKEKNG